MNIEKANYTDEELQFKEAIEEKFYNVDEAIRQAPLYLWEAVNDFLVASYALNEFSDNSNAVAEYESLWKTIVSELDSLVNTIEEMKKGNM